MSGSSTVVLHELLPLPTVDPSKEAKNYRRLGVRNPLVTHSPSHEHIFCATLSSVFTTPSHIVTSDHVTDGRERRWSWSKCSNPTFDSPITAMLRRLRQICCDD